MPSVKSNPDSDSKKTCKNDARYTYTGRELSPLGKGLCAEAMKVGNIAEGRNHKYWIVVCKNGKNLWVQTADDAPLQKETPVVNTAADPSDVSSNSSDALSISAASEDEAVEVAKPKKATTTAKKTTKKTDVATVATDAFVAILA